MNSTERKCVHVRNPQRMTSALNITPPVLRNCTRRARMTIWSVNTAEESLRLLWALSRPTLLGGLSQPSSLPQSPDHSLKGANLSISPSTFPSSSSIRAPPHPPPLSAHTCLFTTVALIDTLRSLHVTAHPHRAPSARNMAPRRHSKATTAKDTRLLLPDTVPNPPCKGRLPGPIPSCGSGSLQSTLIVRERLPLQNSKPL